jgi:hypothetical protein
MKLVLLVLLGLFSGCATEGKFARKLDGWKGRTGTEMISSWGTPRRVVDLPAGGKSYMFDYNSLCRASILVDAADVIQSWSSDGGCWSH